MVLTRPGTGVSAGPQDVLRISWTRPVGISPPVSIPYEDAARPLERALVDADTHRTGARRFIPRAARIRKARAGLRTAADRGGVFHLWTHPFNIASDRDVLLATL